MDCDCQVEVYHFERGIEYVPHQIASKVLSNYKIYQFALGIFFVSDAFVLFEKNWVLATELKQDGLFSFANELIDNIPVKVAIVEGEEKSAWNFTLKSFDVNAEKFLDLEVVESSIGFFFFEDLVGWKLSFLLFRRIGNQLFAYHSLSNIYWQVIFYSMCKDSPIL